MINLITGLPGNAKTLYAIVAIIIKEREDQAKRICDAEKKKGNDLSIDECRPDVYYFNITFNEDHDKYDVVKDWKRLDLQELLSIQLTQEQIKKGDNVLDPDHKVKHGSIIIVDESQDAYPAGSKDPNVKSAINFFTKHRHSGLNFYLITQDPMFIHADARRLVNYHYELDRHGKAEASNVRISPKKLLSECPPDLIKTEFFKFPKEYFGLYKSAVIHAQTHSLLETLKGLPLRIKIVFFFLFFFLGIAIYNFNQGGLNMLNKDVEPVQETQVSIHEKPKKSGFDLNASSQEDQPIFYLSHYLHSGDQTLSVFDYVFPNGSSIMLTNLDLEEMEIEFKEVREGIYFINGQIVTKRPFQKGADNEK